MKVIIIGAGFTGVQLARRLLGERHRVVVIDSDAERIRNVGNQLDCMAVHSEGNSLAVLRRAGIESADALVAVSGSDEVNVIACALADAVFPDVLKLARVRNGAYRSGIEEAAGASAARAGAVRRPPFGIDFVVNPDIEAAEAVIRVLSHGAVGGVIELGGGYGIVTLVIGPSSPLAGLPLWRLSAVEGWHYLVAHVESSAGRSLPGGETVLNAGDRIGVLVKLDEVAALAALCDAGAESVSKIAVVGAGKIGTLVIEGLSGESDRVAVGRYRGGRNPSSRMEVAAVDEAQDRCRALADRFRRVKVFCGDPSDDGLLRDEGLDHYDLVAAVSEDYAQNLVTAAYMKTRGVRRAIALTANTDVSGMALKLGIDVAVSMRSTVVDSIMSHLRGRNVTGVHTVCGGAFEIVECTVDAAAKAAGKTLREAATGGAGLVLMARGADGGWIVPHGDTVLEGGASAVLIVPAGDGRVVRDFSG